MYPMIRDEFGTTDTPEAQDERAANEPVGVVEALSVQAGRTTGDLMRFAKLKTEPEPFFHEGGISSPDELNKKYDLKGENQFKNYMANDTAEEMVQAMKKRKKADETYARFSEQHGYATNLATGFIGALLDPAEDALMFVPGVGEERIAYKLASMGYGKAAAAFISKVGEGATAGMAGAAALEPLRAVMSESELRDWSVRDALTNVFLAAPMGAAMQAGIVPGFKGIASFAGMAKPDPYIRDYSFWDTDATTPEEMARRVQLGVKGGVGKAFDAELAKQPPSFGYIDELARMDPIKAHIFQSSTFAQLMTGRKPNAGEYLFPDHSEQARRLAPEAHAEWDKLQEELSGIQVGHAWGEAPTPEQLNDPAWKLEQQLREHVRGSLPASWDLRVAAKLEPDNLKTHELPMSEIDALKKDRADIESWYRHAASQGEPGWRKGHYEKRAAELDQRIKELETPTHVNEPTKPASLDEVGAEKKPAFKVTDDKGEMHDVNVEQTESTDGKKMVVFSIDNDVAQAKMKKRDDGRWEVAWMKVKEDKRGAGVMGKIYDAIEREYGNQMIPSGLLKEKGYNFWKERNPEAVKYHQRLEDYGSDYHSPRFIKEQIAEFEAELQKAIKSDDRSGAREIREELKPWRSAWNRIPKEGKTPEAIEQMYNFGPTKDAPQGFRGVHSTHADISMIEKEKFGTSADAGYWGRGFYMHPYEIAQNSKTGIFYGRMKEGAKNYLVDVESKKPFYIHNRVAQGSDLKTDWESLHAHGWPHDKAPVHAWSDDNIYNPAKDRVPQEAKDRHARAEEAVSRAHAAINEIVDWNGDLLPGKTAEEHAAAQKVLDEANAEEKAAREAASPNSVISQDFTDALLKAGYDSVIITNNGKPYEMVGIKPGTLKSTFGRDVMYSFGGVGAAKPPKGLRAAKEMENRGHRREDIWADTGWHRAPTGGWRFEIDDSKAELNLNVLKKSNSGTRLSNTVQLDNLLGHPELFKQYPKIAEMNVKIIIDKNNKRRFQGYYYPDPSRHNGVNIYVEAMDVKDAKSVLIHEIQHAIQAREGERGDSWGTPSLANAHPKYRKIMDEAKKAYPNWDADYRRAMVRYAIYQHSTIEIESRLAEDRINFDKDDVKKTPPFPERRVFLSNDELNNIVTKHLGTDIFDMSSYAEYLRGPEYKARQDEISARKDRIRTALDGLREKPEAERAKAKAAAEKETARIEKAKADQEAAKQRAAEAQARAEAIRAADLEVVRTEAQAKKAQADLEKLTKEIQKAAEAQEKARLAAIDAEANLHKANERLTKAEADVHAAEKEHAKLQSELDDLDAELEGARHVVEAEERERLDAAREREGETIVAQGMSDPASRTIWISAMAVDPKLVAREESGHAIKASGLLKQEEWGILRGKAINDGWIDDMPESIRKRYEEAYADRGADGVRDAMIEEAIMHRFAKGPEAWGPEGGPVARFMHRIKELLERIGNWMTSRGFRSAEDVLHAMDSGKVSSRETLAAHPARRLDEIEARMKELEPSIREAYDTARNNSPYDIPTLASIQRTNAKWGEAPAMPQDELTKALGQIYGPKEDQKFTPVKPGEMPPELQLDETRLQTMMEEGYAPDADEINAHLETQRALQEALSMEKGYQQAAECLIMAGMK